MSQLWLVADDCDDTVIQAAKPAHHLVERRRWLQLSSRFDAIQLVLAAKDLRRLMGARERAGHQDIDPGDDRPEAARGSFHFSRALGREGTQCVLTAGGSENLPVLSDRVSNDEQFHGVGLLLLVDEGLDRRGHLEHPGVSGVVVDAADDQHLLVPHDLLR